VIINEEKLYFIERKTSITVIMPTTFFNTAGKFMGVDFRRYKKNI
jgi:peptidyl-tRNA hydrolase